MVPSERVTTGDMRDYCMSSQDIKYTDPVPLALQVTTKNTNLSKNFSQRPWRQPQRHQMNPRSMVVGKGPFGVLGVKTGCLRMYTVQGKVLRFRIVLSEWKA